MGGIKEKVEIDFTILSAFKKTFFWIFPILGIKRVFFIFLFFSKFESCFGIRTGTFGGVKEKEKIDLITPSALKKMFFEFFQFWV